MKYKIIRKVTRIHHNNPMLNPFDSDLSLNFWDQLLSTFRSIDLIFVVIVITFRLLFLLALFRSLSIRVTFKEVRTLRVD